MNAVDEDGSTALRLAVEKGRLEVVKFCSKNAKWNANSQQH